MSTGNILVQSAVAALVVSIAGAAAAQSPMEEMYIKMGAASYAIAATCGASDAELAELQAKAADQARASQPGLSADFEQRMDAAFSEQKAKIAAASPAERAKACEQIEQGLKQMQQKVQP